MFDPRMPFADPTVYSITFTRDGESTTYDLNRMEMLHAILYNEFPGDY